MEVEVRYFLPATGNKKIALSCSLCFCFCLGWKEERMGRRRRMGPSRREKETRFWSGGRRASNSSYLFLLPPFYAAILCLGECGIQHGEKQICSQELLFK